MIIEVKFKIDMVQFALFIIGCFVTIIIFDITGQTRQDFNSDIATVIGLTVFTVLQYNKIILKDKKDI